jgi:hypothetical protein
VRAHFAVSFLPIPPGMNVPTMWSQTPAELRVVHRVQGTASSVEEEEPRNQVQGTASSVEEEESRDHCQVAEETA